MEDYTQAISFTNSYFALVDGLACGLENHLAEDVVLDWFGKRVRGRKSVAAFIRAHKVNSRHIFPNIRPTSTISYNKNRLERQTSFLCETNAFENDPIYGLSEGDLSNLFSLEISTRDMEEIERSINRIKLEEEMAPTMKAMKGECGTGDGLVATESNVVKYVEATGEIEFSRKFRKADTWDTYMYGMRSAHTWRRFARLQIAYSTLARNQWPETTIEDKKPASRFGQPKARLPSLEEIGQLSSRLVPKSENFDFFSEPNFILQSLENEMILKDPQTLLLSPQYEEGKLVFNKPRVMIDSDTQVNKQFLFNYQIHLIIYEGHSKCRVNLLQEFQENRQ